MGFALLPTLIILCTLPISGVFSAWPDCIETGKDYMGDDVISGLRFSNEECSMWCNQIGLRCVKWVYKEKGTTCHVKAILGDIRDSSDPLTPEDKDEFENDVAATTATPGNTAATTTVAAGTTAPTARKKREADETTMSPTDSKQARIDQRIAELKVTHAGDPSCIPPPKVFWPDCTSSGNTSDGTALSANTTDMPNMDMFDCSLACFKDSGCQFWLWKADAQSCSLKSDDGTFSPSVTSFMGARSCVGKVQEEPDSGEQPLDGNWSPWSTLATPCFSKKTGELVACGGGIQYRYRSCTNPFPRAGGKVCPGDDFDENPCNLHNCALPSEYLWSAWGIPSIPCGLGVQKRTTMCGALRRRLPNLPGRDPDDPPVYWPTCLKSVANEAVEESSFTDKSLTECMNDCKTATLNDCLYWTYNKTEGSCKFFGILKVQDNQNLPDIVTGGKFCFGQLFFPHCAETNKNYTGASLVEAAYAITHPHNCTADCAANEDCFNWMIETSGTGPDAPKTCELRGEIPASETPVDVDVAGKTYLFGSSSCVVSTSHRPALSEDAEELSYKEICQSNQYKEMIRVNNTWNKEYCPSPCKDNGPCPRGAQCLDHSDDVGPNHTCVCRMGLVMEGGRCISPPPTTPTPRPVPTLPTALKATAVAITRTASFVLIGFVTATLVLFAIFRIFNHGRFIHMNIEIALLCAHICLLPNVVEDEHMCRNVSIFLHFFFTVAFAFFMLEGVFVYSILGNVVKRNGMLNNTGNFVAGWGAGVLVIAFTVSFEYELYGGEYHCWLNIDTALTFAEFVPITIMVIMTIMMIEAGGTVDETTMTRLDGTDEVQKTSAKYMHRTLIVRVCLCFVTFVVGSLADFEQNLGMYFIFTILNGLLGGFIFFSHCTSNETIRAKLADLWNKMCGKKKTETDTEPLTSEP